ncbi:MAG: type 4a pilus biogenesis protein PilO [Deltaproteobacteria bacterium]|jgi:Tfp pilus assembly protein PilO|nr:type 4a pilus biogenesis protein PilO [Deltaproteobacteria bacterium]
MADIKKIKNVLGKEANSREKILFLAILVVMLVLFLDHLWQPRTKKINMLKIDLKNVQLQIDAVQKLIDATRTQISKLPDKPSKNTEIDPYVKKVLERRIVDFTEEINSTADMLAGRKIASKVEVIKVEVGDRKEEKNFTQVPIRIELRGRYTAIRDYLKALENIGRSLIVNKFSLKRDKGKSTMLNVTVDTTLLIPKG